jgi:hypothetical protein
MAELVRGGVVEKDAPTSEQWTQYQGILLEERKQHAHEPGYQSDYNKQLPGYKALVIGACFADKGLQKRDLDEGNEFYREWLAGLQHTTRFTDLRSQMLLYDFRKAGNAEAAIKTKISSLKAELETTSKLLQKNLSKEYQLECDIAIY